MTNSIRPSWPLVGTAVLLCCVGAVWAQPAEMAFVPAGEFEMGDHYGVGEPDELPVHAVYVSAFYVDVREVTNQQYADYLNSAYAQGSIEVTGGVVSKAGDGKPYCDTHAANPDSRIHWDGSSFTITTGKEDHPMVTVSWYGAAAYANWQSEQDGRTPCYESSTWDCSFSASGYRLPTEAEWEYAARGGLRDPYCLYSWGSDLDGSKANYWQSGDPYETGPYPWTTPVGYYDGDQTPSGSDMSNGYGLYDMTGNIWEWCNDWYQPGYYSESQYSNPVGPEQATFRIHRGGGWGSVAGNLRVARRGYWYPDHRDLDEGFRLVRSSLLGPPPQEELFQGDPEEDLGSSDDPVNTATGSFYHAETDLTAPTRGGLMAFTRHYNSQAAPARGTYKRGVREATEQRSQRMPCTGVREGAADAGKTSISTTGSTGLGEQLPADSGVIRAGYLVLGHGGGLLLLGLAVLVVAKLRRQVWLTLVIFVAAAAPAAGQTYVCGNITEDTTWDLAGSPYVVTCTLTVAEGAILTIEPGIQVETQDDNYRLEVYGQLDASGATFYSPSTNRALQIWIWEDAYGAFSDCEWTGSGAGAAELVYRPDSSGTVLGCTGNWGITLNTGDVTVGAGSEVGEIYTTAGSATIQDSTVGSFKIAGNAVPTITNNTVWSVYPYQLLDPDIDLSGVVGNTYTYADPRVKIHGTLVGSRTWGDVDGLTWYYLDNTLAVAEGAELTLEPGIQVETQDDNYRLEVYGQLDASGATFYSPSTNRALQIWIWEDAYGTFSGCEWTGSGAGAAELVYRPDSSGTVLGCTGNWGITLNTGDVTVGAGSEVGEIYTTAGSATIQDSTVGSFKIAGNAVPTITNNTVWSVYPYQLLDPDIDLSGVVGNTYTYADPRVKIHGTLVGSRTWGDVDGLTWYYLDNTLTVAEGAELTLEPGIQVETQDDNYRLEVYGQLDASGAAFYSSHVNIALQIWIWEGAYGTFSGCEWTGSGAGAAELVYRPDSSGTVLGCTGNWGITLNTGDVTVGAGSEVGEIYTTAGSATIQDSTVGSFKIAGNAVPTITNNTVWSVYPYQLLDPDIDLSGVVGNTYTYADPRVKIHGTLVGSRTWGDVDGLTWYYLDNTLTVAEGAELTLEPGIQVETQDDNYRLEVYGQLDASGATFYSPSTNRALQIWIWEDAYGAFSDCEWTGSGAGAAELVYRPDSSGTVTNCTARGQFRLHSRASTTIHLNNLRFAYIYASGYTGDVIDLERNWWGTTDPAVIAGRITDCNDNPALPCVDYEPFLLGPPPQDELFQGDPEEDLGSSDDPVNTATGSFYRAESDLAAPTRGGLMAFTRHYNSAAASTSRKERRGGSTQAGQLAGAGAGPLREDAAQPSQCNSDDLTVRAAALAVVAATLPGLGLACWFLQHKSRRRTRASGIPRNHQRPHVHNERRPQG